MRVIAGKYRHINLEAPAGLNTRPTLDRVKESLFSIVHFQVMDAVVLDLFAGSGALGIEALSRGAKYVYFNDYNREAVATIKKNLAKLPNCSNFMISNVDYMDFIIHNDFIYDIVLLDPPYKQTIYEEIIQTLLKHNRLSEHAIIVIECEEKNNQIIYNGFRQKTYGYGNKSLVILTRE